MAWPGCPPPPISDAASRASGQTDCTLDSCVHYLDISPLSRDDEYHVIQRRPRRPPLVVAYHVPPPARG